METTIACNTSQVPTLAFVVTHWTGPYEQQWKLNPRISKYKLRYENDLGNVSEHFYTVRTTSANKQLTN